MLLCRDEIVLIRVVLVRLCRPAVCQGTPRATHLSNAILVTCALLVCRLLIPKWPLLVMFLLEVSSAIIHGAW
jgi:hypothetical protein